MGVKALKALMSYNLLFGAITGTKLTECYSQAVWSFSKSAYLNSGVGYIDAHGPRKHHQRARGGEGVIWCGGSQACNRVWEEMVGCDRLVRDDPYLLQCLCQLHRQVSDQWSTNLVLGPWSAAGFLFCQVVNCSPPWSQVEIGPWSRSLNENYLEGIAALWTLRTLEDHLDFYTCRIGNLSTWPSYMEGMQSEAMCRLHLQPALVIQVV